MTGDVCGSATGFDFTMRAQHRHQDVPWYLLYRQGRYKYIRYVGKQFEELYDLQADPEELTNLAAKPAHAERLAALRTAAEAEMRRTGAAKAEQSAP